MAEHLLAIERNDLSSAVGKVVRQKSATYRESIASKWYVDINLLDLNFEYVARLRLCNRNGTRENMSAGAAILHLVVDCCVVSRNVFRSHTARFQPLIRPA